MNVGRNADGKGITSKRFEGSGLKRTFISRVLSIIAIAMMKRTDSVVMFMGLLIPISIP